ncbi:MAG: TonB-dependent receptor [Rhodovulum sulfidophilum]|uniref:TonB-dependent receptor n=1 Tax=Rhodovulum sulfidophilum TaxID=35806 RepID=A0A2W5NIU6_RHOSU|nr:MAG: TonB-dependent receptor [Rhodovulum sulfidophilum]
MRTTIVAVSAAILAQTTLGAEAQDWTDAPLELDPIIVSGGLTPVPAEQFGRAVSVVTAEDLARRQTTYVADALRALPGVAVSRTGGYGGQTQVRIRGAEGNHTVVLIDGIEASAPENGEFDFGGLLTADIARIEVLRGPQSAIYGSNAIGGVISITTKQAEAAGTRYEASTEVGTDGTVAGLLAARRLTERANLSFSLAGRDVGGYDISGTGGEDDGDVNVTANARASYQLTDTLLIGGSLRYVDRSSDYDDFIFGAPSRDELVVDADLVHERTEFFGSAFATLEAFGGRMSNEVRLNYSDMDDRNLRDGVRDADTTSGRTTLRYLGTVALDAATIAAARQTLSFGVERIEESFENNDASLVFDPSQMDKQTRDLTSFIGQYRGTFLEALSLQANIRYDHNDGFDDVTTWSLAGSYILPNATTRLHASYGTGSQNPTLFEQFGFIPGSWIGNPDLKPEESRGWDFGVEQAFLAGRAVIDVTYFEDRLKDEISSTFDPATGESTPFNEDGTSRRKGIEVAGTYEVTERFTAGLAYTWLDATDPDGQREVRRPEQEVALNLDWALPNDRTVVNLDIRRVIDNLDFDYTAPSFGAERVKLDDYTLVNLAAEHMLTETVTLTGRIENLFDADYQELDGYATPGITAFIGLRSVF